MVAPSDTTGNTHSLHPDENGIEIHGWTIRTEQNPIATSDVEKELSSQLSIKLPAMLFDKNSLRVAYSHSPYIPCEFELNFNTVDALAMVGQADPSIQVKAADRWQNKSSRSDVEVAVLEGASDWTFSTKYPGTLIIKGKQADTLDSTWNVPPTISGQSLVEIDYSSLRDTNIPILYSSQVILFEDELDDNGTASYKVRIRVMPTFIFILARFFLRVDGVFVRIWDTRYFHRFGTQTVVRECQTREAHHKDSLRDVHASVLRDPDIAARAIPVTFSALHNFILPHE